jgi:hypothetical protein
MLFNYNWVFFSGKDCGYTHSKSGSSSSGGGDGAAIMAIIFLVLFLVFLSCIAIGYLFYEVEDYLERLYFNEGQAQALMSLMIIAASTTASSLIACFLVATPLTLLAFAAGISSPVGFIIFVSCCIGLFGGAGANLINSFVQDKFNEKMSSELLVPKDPYRFTLTTEEEQDLFAKDIDPIKVKCALIALSLKHDNKPKKSFFAKNRHNEKVNDTIQKVRKLRSGTAFNNTVKVGDMNFNCSKTPVAVAIGGDTTASAPPLDPGGKFPMTI